METRALSPSELVDLAESLRHQGRCAEAKKTLERCLEQKSAHPRGLLLLSRLQYQEGKFLEARETLRLLEPILGGDESLNTISGGLERLRQRSLETDPAFVTETMAGLLVEQGYLLEALDIYRQLFVASAGEKQLWGRILSLRERVKQEGSRGAGQEKVAEQLEALERWIETQKRED